MKKQPPCLIYLRKAASFFLALTLVLPGPEVSILWAQTAAVPLAVGSSASLPVSPRIPELPAELGLFESAAPGKGPLIVHIQTAHGHEEAQRKIAAILQHLKNHYGISTVLVEGSAHQLDPALLDFETAYPGQGEKILEELLKRGWLKGAELFLAREDGARAYGIEDQETYVANGQAFQEVLRAKKSSEQFLNTMEMQIERLRTAYLSAPLRDFLRRYELWDRGQVPLEVWARELPEHAREVLKTELQDPAAQLDWPQLTRLLALLNLESEISEKEFQSEKDAFFESLDGVPLEVQKKIRTLLDLPLSSPGARDLGVPLAVEDLAASLPDLTRLEPFAQILKRVRYLVLQSELQAAGLYSELHEISREILSALAGDDTRQQKILETLEDYRLLGKLLSLEAAPLDYDAMLTRSETVRPKSLAARFLELNEEGRVRDFSFENTEAIERLSELALEFYKGVRARDTAMLRNVEKRLRETGAESVAVITGGFHAGPFEDYFRRAAYGYARITPVISGAGDHSLYIRSAFEMGLTFAKETWETPFISDPAFLPPALRDLPPLRGRSELRSTPEDLPEDPAPAPAIARLTPETRKSEWDYEDTLESRLGEGERTSYVLGSVGGKPAAFARSKSDTDIFLAQEALFSNLEQRRDLPNLIGVVEAEKMLVFGLLPEGGDLLSSARAVFLGHEIRERLLLIRQLGRTIAYLHSRGVLHRDIKPSNIFLHPELLQPAEWSPERLEQYPPVLFDFENSVLLDRAAAEGKGPYETLVAQEKKNGMNALSRDFAPVSDITLSETDNFEVALRKDSIRFQHEFFFDFFSFGVSAAWIMGIDARGTKTSEGIAEAVRDSALPENLQELFLELLDKERKITDPESAWQLFFEKVDAALKELPETEAKQTFKVEEEKQGASERPLPRTLALPPALTREDEDKTVNLLTDGSGTNSLLPSPEIERKMEEMLSVITAARELLETEGEAAYEKAARDILAVLQKLWSDQNYGLQMERIMRWLEKEWDFRPDHDDVHQPRFFRAVQNASEIIFRSNLLRGLTPPENVTRVYLGGDGFNQLILDPEPEKAGLVFVNRFSLLLQEEFEKIKTLIPLSLLPYENAQGDFVEREEGFRRTSLIAHELVNRGIVYRIMRRIIYNVEAADPTPRNGLETRDSTFFRRELEKAFQEEIKSGAIADQVRAEITALRARLNPALSPEAAQLDEFFRLQTDLLAAPGFLEAKAREFHRLFRTKFPGEGPFQILDIGAQGVQQFLIELGTRLVEGDQAPVFYQRLGTLPGTPLDHYDFSDSGDLEDLASLEYYRLFEYAPLSTDGVMSPAFREGKASSRAAAILFLIQSARQKIQNLENLKALKAAADLPEKGFLMLDMDDTLTPAPATLESMPRTVEEIIRALHRGVPVVINTLNNTAETRRRVFEPIRMVLEVQRNPQLLSFLTAYTRRDGESFSRLTGTMPMTRMTISPDGQYHYEDFPEEGAKVTAIRDFQRRSGRLKFVFYDDQFGPGGWASPALELEEGLYINVDEHEDEVPGTLTDEGARGVKGTARWLRLLNAVIDTGRPELRSTHSHPDNLIELSEKTRGLLWEVDERVENVLGQGARTRYYRGTFLGKPAAFAFSREGAEEAENFISQAEVFRTAADIPGVVRLRAYNPERKFLVFDIFDPRGAVMSEAHDIMNRWGVHQRLQILTKIAETYEALAAKGILHRDLKPDNIYLPPLLVEKTDWNEEDLKDNPPLIFDFDLAMLFDPVTGEPAAGYFQKLYLREKSEGMVALTPDYAPYSDAYASARRQTTLQLREGSKSFQHEMAFDLFSFGVTAAWMFGRNISGLETQEKIDREIEKLTFDLSLQAFLKQLTDKEQRTDEAVEAWRQVVKQLKKLGDLQSSSAVPEIPSPEPAPTRPVPREKSGDEKPDDSRPELRTIQSPEVYSVERDFNPLNWYLENEDGYVSARVNVPDVPLGRGQLVVVLDGFGGTTLMKFVQENFYSVFEYLLSRQGTRGGPRNIPDVFRNTFRVLQKAFQEGEDQTGQVEDSGTTVSAVYVPDDEKTIYTAYVGDSPIAVFNSSKTLYLTSDHNVRTNAREREYAQRRARQRGFTLEVERDDSGKLTYLKNSMTGDKLQVTRSIVGSDIFPRGIISARPVLARIPYDFSEGPVFVLTASDGVVDHAHYEREEHLREIFERIRAGVSAQELADSAPGGDDRTAILLKLQEKPRSELRADEAPEPEISFRLFARSGLTSKERSFLISEIRKWGFFDNYARWNGRSQNALVVSVNGKPAGAQAFHYFPDRKSVAARGLFVSTEFRRQGLRLGFQLRRDWLRRLKSEGVKYAFVPVDKTEEAQGFHRAWVKEIGEAAEQIYYQNNEEGGKSDLIATILVNVQKYQDGRLEDSPPIILMEDGTRMYAPSTAGLGYRAELRDFEMLFQTALSTPVELSAEEIYDYFGEEAFEKSLNENIRYYLRALRPEDLRFLKEWKKAYEEDLERPRKEGEEDEWLDVFPGSDKFELSTVGLISVREGEEFLEGYAGVRVRTLPYEGLDAAGQEVLHLQQIEAYYRNRGRSGELRGISTVLIDFLLKLAAHPESGIKTNFSMTAVTPGSDAVADRYDMAKGAGEYRYLTLERILEAYRERGLENRFNGDFSPQSIKALEPSGQTLREDQLAFLAILENLQSNYDASPAEAIETRDGLFVPSDVFIAAEIFRQILKGGEHVVDLGSGLGGVLFTAAAMGASKATGFESDPRYFRNSREIFRRLENDPRVLHFMISQKVEILRRNFMRANLTDVPDPANTVFYYFDLGARSEAFEKEKFLAKIKKLPPGSRFVVHMRQGLTDEDLAFLNLEEKISHEAFSTYVYQVPFRRSELREDEEDTETILLEEGRLPQPFNVVFPRLTAFTRQLGSLSGKEVIFVGVGGDPFHGLALAYEGALVRSISRDPFYIKPEQRYAAILEPLLKRRGGRYDVLGPGDYLDQVLPESSQDIALLFNVLDDPRTEAQERILNKIFTEMTDGGYLIGSTLVGLGQPNWQRVMSDLAARRGYRLTPAGLVVPPSMGISHVDFSYRLFKTPESSESRGELRSSWAAPDGPLFSADSVNARIYFGEMRGWMLSSRERNLPFDQQIAYLEGLLGRPVFSQKLGKNLPVINSLLERGGFSAPIKGSAAYQDSLDAEVLGGGRVLIEGRWLESWSSRSPRGLYLLLDSIEKAEAKTGKVFAAIMGDENLQKNLSRVLLQKQNGLNAVENARARVLIESGRLQSYLPFIAESEIEAYQSEHDYGVVFLHSGNPVLRAFGANFEMAADEVLHPADETASAFLMPGLLRAASLIRGLREPLEQRRLLQSRIQELFPGASLSGTSFIIRMGEYVSRMLIQNRLIETAA